MMPYLTSGLKKYGIFLGFLAVVIALSLLSPAFLTFRNLANIVRQTSIHGIMAVGMTFVILTAGIDLSVGSTLALAGVLCASFAHRGWPLPLVVGRHAADRFAAGAAQRPGHHQGQGDSLRCHPRHDEHRPRRGASVHRRSPSAGSARSFASWEPASCSACRCRSSLFLLSVVVAAALLRRTRWGRYLYAIGGNLQAAKLSGIPVDRCTTLAYVLCGLTAAASAVVLTARLNAAESIAGAGYELDVIASVVIGGTSLAGGRGGVWGTLLGALLIGTINNGMNLLQISAYFQLVVKGAIIVGAVLLDRLRLTADSP